MKCIQACNLFIAEVAEGLATVAEFKQILLGREIYRYQY